MMATSRRRRRTTPQVEALENIISLSGITAGYQISNGGHTSPHLRPLWGVLVETA